MPVVKLLPYILTALVPKALDISHVIDRRYRTGEMYYWSRIFWAPQATGQKRGSLLVLHRVSGNLVELSSGITQCLS